MADVTTSVNAKLTADDSNFTAGFSRASQAAQNFTSSVSQSQTKMAAIAGAVGGLASTFGMSMIAMTKSAADFAFNTVADFEQTRIGFEGILGGAAQAKDMLGQLQAFAATTPFEFTELATSTKQLLAVGYASSEVIPMMTKLGDAAANLGLSSEAMKMTIRAFGQIRGAGKAMTQDLYQISNALPGFNPFKAIGDDIGKTQAEVRKMVEGGLIPADQAIEAILKGMQNMPGAAGAMSRQVETIKGQMSNLADTIQINLIKGFGDTSGAVSALKGVVAAVGPVMAGTFKAVGAVVEVLTPIFKTLGNALSVVYQTVKPFAAILAGAVLIALKLAAGAITALLTPLNAMLTYFKENPAVLRTVAAAVIGFYIAINASTIATKLATIGNWLLVASQKAIAGAAAIAQGGIARLNAVMAFNPATLWIAGIAALIAILVLAWQNSETFRNVVTGAIDAVARVVGVAIKFILEAIGNYVMALGEAMDGNTQFGKVIRSVYTFILTVIKTVIVAVLRLYSWWLGAISDAINSNGLLGQVVAAIFNFIAKTVITVIGTVLKMFGLFLQGISELMQSNQILGNIIASIFDFIWSTIAKVVAGVSGLLGTWLYNIADWLLSNKDAMNTLAKIFGFIVGVVGDVVKGVLGTIKTVITGMSSFLKGAANAAADFIDTIASGLAKVPGMGALASLIKSGASSVRQAGNTITGEMDKVANSIQGVINGVTKFQAEALKPENYTAVVQNVKNMGMALKKVSAGALKASEIKMGADIVNAISAGLGTVGKFVEGMGDKVLEFTEVDMGTALVNMISSAAKGAKGAVDIALGFVEGLNVGQIVDSTFDNLSSFAKTVGRKIFDMGAIVAAYTESGFTGKVTEAIATTIDAIKAKLGLSDAAEVIAKSNDDYKKAVEDASKLTDPAKSILSQADTMAKVRDAMKKGLDQVSQVLDDLKKASADFAKSLKDSIMGFAGLAGIELPDGFIPQAKSLIKNMEMRLKKSQEFAVQIGQLQALGLNATSLQTILEEGPLKGAQFAASILSGGLEAVKQINALEGSIAAVGATLGSIGSNAVYGADIKSATDYISGLTGGNPTMAQYGDVITIADGAFKTTITIDGGATSEEQVQMIQDGIEAKFQELARALAARTGA